MNAYKTSMGIFLSVFLAVLLITGVFTPTFANPVHEENSLVNEFVNFGFDPCLPAYILREDNALIKRFGKPLKIERSTSPDEKEAGLNNEEIIYYFNGLVVHTFEGLSSSRLWLKEVMLTNDKYPLVGSLKAGQPLSRFTKALGKYHSKEPNMVTYAPINEKGEHVYFPGIYAVIFYNPETGSVNRVRWSITETYLD